MSNNVVSDNIETIYVSFSYNNRLEENLVKKTVGGIVLGYSSYKAKENIVMNSKYGIALVFLSEYNKIEQNKALANSEFDLFWDQTGIGNIWEENRCKTKNW